MQIDIHRQVASIDGKFPDLPVVSRGSPHDSQPFGLAWERTALPSLAQPRRRRAVLPSKGEIVSHLGVDPEGIHVAYSGLDETFREPGEGAAFDLPDRSVLSVGAMNPRKNRSLEGSADVLTPGYLTRGELKYAYTHADLFAYPSLYEGFGLPPLEAMACGTPGVAGDDASLPEVLGDAAEFVDPHDVGAIADGMEQVLEDPEYAGELERRGREKAAEYT